jgi:8-oxo-dGTP pyrophosphatase MutT (NUDIX family)
MNRSKSGSTSHIIERTRTTDTLRVKLASTVIVARRRLTSTNVLSVSDLPGADNIESRISYLFGQGNDSRNFTNGWEFLLGQSECQNYLRTPQNGTPSLMRYGGEYKFAGGSVDVGESIEDAARRELAEEFLCTVPTNAVLRLLDVKQTRPVQNTSYIMHNFVCLEAENPWLKNLDVQNTNELLAQRRSTFKELMKNNNGEKYFNMTKEEKELVCPEVQSVAWLDMKTAVTNAFTSMNSDSNLTFVNDFQRLEFERLNISNRDPLFITMTIMLHLDDYADVNEVVNATKDINVEEERELVQWLQDGMSPDEVSRVMGQRERERQLSGDGSIEVERYPGLKRNDSGKRRTEKEKSDGVSKY